MVLAVTALTLDMSAAGAATFNDKITAVGTSVFTNLDISGDIDVDGTTNLDIVDIDGAVNIATTALVTGVLTTTATPIFNGGFTSNAVSTINTSSADATLTLTDTNAGASDAPELKLFKNSASPADSDNGGLIGFHANNDAGQDTLYASITMQQADVSDGTEDAKLIFASRTAGSLTTKMQLDDSGVHFNDNIKARFGTGHDLNIYHDGSNSYIEDASAGDLILKTDGAEIKLMHGAEHMIKCVEDAQVNLYYDNAVKLATASGGITVTGDSTVTDDIILNSDSAAITFGADADVSLIHVADKGLTIKTNGTGDGVFPILNLSAGQTDMQGSDPLGRIDFQAPDEGTGTDAILVAGRIQVVSEGDFSASNNATSMQLAVGASGTAGTVMTLTSTGRVVSQATAKTWIDFNGQSTVSIRDSHNVSGLGDEGTGYYTVSHDVDLATVNAAAVSSASGSANTYNDGVSTAHQAVGSFTVMGWHGTNGTATDHERFYVVVFGD